MKTLSTTLLLFFLSLSLYSQDVGYVKMRSHKKPIIQAEINGKKGYFLIDTGSDISVINTDELKKYKLEASKIYGDQGRAIGFNGQTAAVMKLRNANVIFDERYDHNQFYTLNISNLVKTIEAKTNIKISGIVGTDFLTMYNCVIDYNQRQLILVDSRTKRKLASK